MPSSEEPPANGDGYCLSDANQVQHSPPLCQWEVQFWTLAPFLCCRVGSRGRTRGPRLAMIHWIPLGTLPFPGLLLIRLSTLVLFSGQLKSFLPLRAAYHAKVHSVDMALTTLARCKIRGATANMPNHGMLVPPLLYGWLWHSVEVS